jgi:bacillithiol system protein YtxJ
MGFFDKLFGKSEEELPQVSQQLEWFNLTSIDDLDAAIELSHKRPILIFKHSTRCSISTSALERLRRFWDGNQVNVQAFYLDLLNHRDVSGEIAERLKVEHQSPQMILVKDGEAIFNSSHQMIDFRDVQTYAPSN